MHREILFGDAKRATRGRVYGFLASTDLRINAVCDVRCTKESKQFTHSYLLLRP